MWGDLETEDRRRGVAALAQIRSERVVEPLFRAAGDADEEVAGTAVQALAEMGESVTKLIRESLEKTERRRKIAALRCLIARPREDSDTVKSLFRVAADADEEVAGLAMRVLMSTEETTEESAIELLHDWQCRDLRDWLSRMIRDLHQSTTVRVHAGRSLALAGDPRPGVGVRSDGLPDIVWCEVPAGPFLMGSTDEDGMAYDWEKPQHTYEIEQPYAISRYPVTNAQYAAFVQAGGYAERRYWTEDGWAWRERSDVTDPGEYGTPYNLLNHPVVGVSWYEAIAFCRWLTEELRQNDTLSETQEITLPTEPQWEKAARSIDGRIYPWGSEPDPEKANYDDTGIGTTNAVGCFPGGASPYGVEELSGNVWEWCRTKWESDYEHYQNDIALEGSARRVVRGGAFLSSVAYVRCAYRVRDYPDGRVNYYGFRVVVSPFRRTE
jgi:formylglycine-generating enzyme required for sulfatase activity